MPDEKNAAPLARPTLPATPSPRRPRRRVLMPLLLAASLTGCATTLPPSRPAEPPRLPAPPAELMQPPSSGKWSESVRALLSKWRKLLTPAKDS